MTDTVAAVVTATAERPAEAMPIGRRQVHRRRRLGPGKRIRYGSLLGPAVVLALWCLASWTGTVNWRTLPAPWTVVNSAGHLWRVGTLGPDIVISLRRAALGFLFGASGGVILALLSGLSRIGEALIDSTVQVKRAIPSLGLIPLFILWMGIGEGFKVAIIAIGVFIPIYINTYAALIGIDTRYVELAEVVQLNRLQFILHVVIPGALPGFFIGLRLGVVGSWLSLVVLEQINATSGLGYMMYQAQNYGQTNVIVVGLVIYGAFGFVSDRIVRLIERRVLSWRRTLSN